MVIWFWKKAYFNYLFKEYKDFPVALEVLKSFSSYCSLFLSTWIFKVYMPLWKDKNKLVAWFNHQMVSIYLGRCESIIESKSEGVEDDFWRKNWFANSANFFDLNTVSSRFFNINSLGNIHLWSEHSSIVGRFLEIIKKSVETMGYMYM